MKNKIGLGTAAIGRPHYINIRQDKVQDCSLEEFQQQGLDLVKHAYDLGIRYFDTAPGYGLAEQLLLNWDKPMDAEIATKWGYTYTANFDLNAVVHEVKEHSINKLKEQWKYSQALLPQLTSYQIHSATFETGVLENELVLNFLEELKQSLGLKIGLTTTGSNQLEVAKKALDVYINGAPLFDLFQVTYNIFDQSLLELMPDLAQSKNRIVVKEALANGRVFPTDQFQHYQAAYKELTQLATKYSVGVDAIALRFCIDSIPSFVVLSGAATKGHLIDNLKALDFKLEQVEINTLKNLAVSREDYWSERKTLPWN